MAIIFAHRALESLKVKVFETLSEGDLSNTDVAMYWLQPVFILSTCKTKSALTDVTLVVLSPVETAWKAMPEPDTVVDDIDTGELSAGEFSVFSTSDTPDKTNTAACLP